MADLQKEIMTDDEEMETWLSVIQDFSYDVGRAHEMLFSAIHELRGHRARIAADKERVRQVVRHAIATEQRDSPGTDVWYPTDFANAIANRVADELCKP